MEPNFLAEGNRRISHCKSQWVLEPREALKWGELVLSTEGAWSLRGLETSGHRTDRALGVCAHVHWSLQGMEPVGPW